MIKPGPAIHNYPQRVFQSSKMGWRTVTTPIKVRVMNKPVEGYVMVRRKGCAPYVAPVKEIEQ